MIKKYLVRPGFVYSSIDGDRHYITDDQLMKLYRVNPKECLLDMGKTSLVRFDPTWLKTLILLLPREDGNYEL